MTKQNCEIETDRRHVACRTVLSASSCRLGERLMMARSAFSGAEEPFPHHRKARTASPESLYDGAEKALPRPRKGSSALPENIFRHAERHNALCDSLLAETLKTCVFAPAAAFARHGGILAVLLCIFIHHVNGVIA